MAAVATPVGVVGAGTMGAGIAQLALEAGHPVWVHDVDAAAIERGRARIRSGLERRAARLDLDPIPPTTGSMGACELHEAPTLDDLAAAGPDLVVEAALEDLEAKRAIFRALDATTPADGDPGHEHERAVGRRHRRRDGPHPERVIGLHFFNPAPVMPLVEVVATAAADPAILDRATTLMTAWGKVPVRCRDTPGFIVNRVNRPFTLEALAMLDAGEASIEAIDAAMRADGYPMGPFELMDLVGIDINLAAARGVFAGSVAAGDRWPSVSGRHRSRSGSSPTADSGARRLGLLRLRRRGPPDRACRGVRAHRRTATIGSSAPRSPSASRWPSSTRPIGRPATASRPPDDIDLAMRLGANHPSGPFERALELGGRTSVLDLLRYYESEGPRFHPAPALRAAV